MTQHEITTLAHRLISDLMDRTWDESNIYGGLLFAKALFTKEHNDTQAFFACNDGNAFVDLIDILKTWNFEQEIFVDQEDIGLDLINKAMEIVQPMV
jgi:hypothetical protein